MMLPRIGVVDRLLRKSPDRIVEFAENRAVLPTVDIDIPRFHAAIIIEGDLIMIGAESFKISSAN